MQDNQEEIRLQFKKEIIGSLKRKKRFDDGERITLAELVEKHGAHEKMCKTCAFLEDSPERTDAAVNYPSQYWTILLAILSAVKQTGPYQPFFCHRKMPTRDGGQNFQPELDDEGMPKTDKICAGWLAEVKQQIDFQDRLKNEERIENEKSL